MALAAQAPARPGCERIQYRVTDTVWPPWAPNSPTARIRRNSANGWWYTLNDTIVLDERAITSIGVDSLRLSAETAWMVIGRLAPAGTQALSDASANHIGQMLTILIGDDLIDVPIIESKLTTTRVLLQGHASRGVADSLATRARRAIAPGCVARKGP